MNVRTELFRRRAYALHLILRPLAVAAFMTVSALSAGQAQEAPSVSGEPIDVGVYVNAPFVERKDDGSYSGLAIELWEDLAAALGREFRYVEFETVHDLVDATESDNIDVAVTNLSINETRAKRVDFTQPWYDGGNRIMIGDGQGNPPFEPDCRTERCRLPGSLRLDRRGHPGGDDPADALRSAI